MASYDDTATVSGSVVSFSDGADEVPIKSWQVEIAPTLTGKSAVECTQTGSNLVALNASPQQAKRDYGVTVNTQTADILNITSTGIAYSCERLFYSFKKGTYAVKFQATSSDSYTPVISIYRTNGTGVKFNIQPNTLTTFTLADDADIDIRFFASGSGDTTVRTVEFSYLQIEVGSTVSTYSQYNSTIYTASLGRTIYGGTADVVNGEGKDGFSSILISETSWTYDSANARFISANLTGMKNVAIRTLHVMAYGYETIDDARPIGNVPDQAIYNANYERKVIIHDSNYTNVTDFLSAKGNIAIIYPLATATDFTFTPITPTPETALGTNNFWSEQGNTELTYYKSGYGFTSVTVHKETPNGEPVVQTVKFHKIVYGGQADVVRGICEPKNLFVKDNPNEVDGYFTTTGFSTGNANAKTVYIPIVGGETYTVSKTAGQRFQIATAGVIPSNGASFTGRQANNTATSLTITASANDKYLWAWVFLDGTDTGTLADMLDSVQIEKGSSATEYVPGFTPFTFPPISMSTDEGENTLFANEGASAITYRKAVD